MSETDERPHPPGHYPIVVVGSGPGGLQAAYLLRRRGIAAAVLSRDESPGGMFHRFPNFGRLLSWTKPIELRTEAGRSAERYDWNALIADPQHRVDVAEFIETGFLSPSRPEMVRALGVFAERARLAIRFGCEWQATERLEHGFRIQTSDGPYTCDVLIMALGMAVPWRPDIEGLEMTTRYEDVGPATDYRGKRVFVLGKQNSGFEIADALWPHARQVIVASPEPTRFTAMTGTMAGARTRYIQPFEDHLLGAGTFVLDAALDRVERIGSHFAIELRGTTTPAHLRLEVDEVLTATGFATDLGDLPACGVETFGRSSLPVLDEMWQTTVPGLYVAGTLMLAARGLRKHGIPSNSGAIQGYRYNIGLLVDHLASTRFGWSPERRQIGPEELCSSMLERATREPALHCQRGYLAWVAERHDGVWAESGLHPLAAFVDGSGDAVAVTVEKGEDGIAPVVYRRTSAEVSEHRLAPHPLMDYETPEHLAEVGPLLVGG